MEGREAGASPVEEDPFNSSLDTFATIGEYQTHYFCSEGSLGSKFFIHNNIIEKSNLIRRGTSAIIRQKESSPELFTERKRILHQNFLAADKIEFLSNSEMVLVVDQIFCTRYDFLKAEHVLFVSNGFFGGETLRNIFRQLMEALSFAHSKGLKLGHITLHTIYVVNEDKECPWIKLDIRMDQATQEEQKDDYKSIGLLLLTFIEEIRDIAANVNTCDADDRSIERDGGKVVCRISW